MESGQPVWHIKLLGGFHARRDSLVFPPFPTQKTGALLALLAFPPARPHSREKLIDTLWPEATLAAGRNRLNQALVWLRPQLEPPGSPRGSVLLTDRLSVSLNPTTVVTDVAEFEAALVTARQQTTPVDHIAVLEHAVALYGGELLPGEVQEWTISERYRLSEAYRLALRQLVALYEREREYERALQHARSAVNTDPLQEESHADLIRLLLASEQPAAARRQYMELTRVLEKELGVSPAPTTAALLEQKTQSFPYSPPPVVGSPMVLIHPLPLPAPLTRFFGREAEIERLQRMLEAERSRLVTLIGSGGTGKTRLAVEVAGRLQSAFDGAIAFAPLADLTNAGQIPAAIADTLGLARSGAVSPLDQIAEALAVPPFLLLLDNLEHLLPDAALLVGDLLARTPGLTILTTSRQRLGLEGEQELSLLPLALPSFAGGMSEALASPGIQLFVDRARAVRSDFEITAANAEAVVRLCERLEGMPLAIELCAAWAQILTPRQMLEKLDRRFDFLISRRRDIPARHRTLRAALEYSYLQLPSDLQRFFARLCVFRGGASLEAVEAICQTPALNALAELRDRSLVIAEEAGDGMRYRMLESLREYATEQLLWEESQKHRRAHTLYFLHLAEQAEAEIVGPDQKRWLACLDTELDNLRAALNWALESDEITLGLRLGSALRRYWYTRGYLQEGYDWLRRLLERAELHRPLPEAISSPVRARAWETLGYLAWSQGDYPMAQTAHETALQLRRDDGDRHGEAESLYHLGITEFRRGDNLRAEAFLNACLQIAQEIGNRSVTGRVLQNLSNIANQRERPDEAETLLQQSFAIARELGNRQLMAGILNNLGLVARRRNDSSQAARSFQEAIAIYQDIADNVGLSVSLSNLGRIYRIQGNYRQGWSLLVDSTKLNFRIGNKPAILTNLMQIGLLALSEGHSSWGTYLLSAALHIGDSLGIVTDAEAEERNTFLYAARQDLGHTAFESAWESGRCTTLAQAVAEALAASERAHEEAGERKF